MRRRDFFGRAWVRGASASASLAAPALIAPRPASAFFFGGGGVDVGGIIAVLTTIQEILDSRFAEMLENAAALDQLASVTEQLNAVLDLYARARSAFHTLDAIAETFARIYQAAEDLDFHQLRASHHQLLSRLKTLSRQAANLQAAVVSSAEWEVATTQLLTAASRGTTSVTGQMQIAAQLQGLLLGQGQKTQALLAIQTEIMAEELAARQLEAEEAGIMRDQFFESFRTRRGDPTLALPLPGISPWWALVFERRRLSLKALLSTPSCSF